MLLIQYGKDDILVGQPTRIGEPLDGTEGHGLYLESVIQKKLGWVAVKEPLLRVPHTDTRQADYALAALCEEKAILYVFHGEIAVLDVHQCD